MKHFKEEFYLLILQENLFPQHLFQNSEMTHSAWLEVERQNKLHMTKTLTLSGACLSLLSFIGKRIGNSLPHQNEEGGTLPATTTMWVGVLDNYVCHHKALEMGNQTESATCRVHGNLIN